MPACDSYTTLRLTLVIHSLAGGGAERTAAHMASHWAENPTLHEADDQTVRVSSVTLITLDAGTSDRYPLDSRVERIALDVMQPSATPFHAATANLRRIRLLRRAIRDSQPDIVLSFTDKTNVLTVAACRPIGLPVIVAERTVPWRHPIGPLWSRLRRWAYSRSAAIVVQTDAVADHLRRQSMAAPIHVIPNCVWLKSEDLSSREETTHDRQTTDRPIIAAAGRLSHEKGFDLLIEAFGRIAKRHPDWRLHIIGDGEQRQALEQLIGMRGLSEQVELPGWLADPHAIFQQSELFVLSSRYEGFPNALLEAMSCGAAPISFDCDAGPREIIRDQTDGVLVPAENIDALSQAIESLILDQPRRRLLGQRATEATERFSVARYFQQWNALVGAAARHSP